MVQTRDLIVLGSLSAGGFLLYKYLKGETTFSAEAAKEVKIGVNYGTLGTINGGIYVSDAGKIYVLKPTSQQTGRIEIYKNSSAMIKAFNTNTRNSVGITFKNMGTQGVYPYTIDGVGSFAYALNGAVRWQSGKQETWRKYSNKTVQTTTELEQPYLQTITDPYTV
jgi:hypothetical protein